MKSPFWILMALLMSGPFLLLGQGTNEPNLVDSLLDIYEYTIEPVLIKTPYHADNLTPVSFQNIDISQTWDLKNTGQEPSFLLSETPSMTVYSDAGSYQGYSYFRLRGMDQTRINMSLDGVPLNEPEDQGVYFSNYPDFLSSTPQLQIQRGVGTTQNGIANYAGSLLFSSPSILSSRKITAGLGYGSYNTYRVFGEYGNRIAQNTDAYVRLSHLHSDGFKDRSANTSSSALYKCIHYAQRWTFKFTGFTGNQRNEMAWLGVPLATLDDNPRANANSQENDEFTQSLSNFRTSYKINQNSTLKASIYYNYLNGNYDFDFNNFLGLPSTDELYNYAFRSHFGGVFTTYTLKTNKLNWTSGIHGNLYSRRHIGSEASLGQLYTNTGFKNAFSAFSKGSYELGKLLLYADIQFRHTNFRYRGGTEIEPLYWNFLNPKAGLTYSFSDKLNVYYSIGSSQREPTRTDLFGGNDDLLADSLGNPVLFISEPERVIDHELGLRFSGKKVRLNLNGYFIDFDNEIVLNGQFGPNGLALNSNVDQSYRMGLELTARYSPYKWLELVNSTSFSRNRIKQSGEIFQPILSPDVIVNQEFIFEKKRLQTGLSIRYQGASFIDFANENSIEAYMLLNWRASYSFKKVRLSVFVNNLTNTRYFNNAYVDFDGTNKYFQQAPINFYSSLTFSF